MDRVSTELKRIEQLYHNGKISYETVKFMRQYIGPRLQWRMIVEGW